MLVQFVPSVVQPKRLAPAEEGEREDTEVVHVDLAGAVRDHHFVPHSVLRDTVVWVLTQFKRIEVVRSHRRRRAIGTTRGGVDAVDAVDVGLCHVEIATLGLAVTAAATAATAATAAAAAKGLELLGHAKVGDLDLAVGEDENVFNLQVPVGDGPVLVAVEDGQPDEHLADEVAYELVGHRPAAPEVPHVAVFGVLHDDVGSPAEMGRPTDDVVDANDVVVGDGTFAEEGDVALVEVGLVVVLHGVVHF